MAIFSVALPLGNVLRRGADLMIVSAASSADAIIAARSRFGGDADWSSATATQLNDVLANAANALVGWTFRCVISTVGTGAVIVDVTVTGDATNDLLDEIGTLLATALNATAPISNASYTAGTQTLIAAQGASDALGDKNLRMEIFPPAILESGQVVNQPVHHSGFVSSITHQGAASADLTVVFAADTFVLPIVQLVAAARN